MDAYQTSLSTFLGRDGVRQEDIAAKIGKSQPALNRYARGRRFPDSATARLIDEVTQGAVPFDTWQSVALERMGITTSEQAAA